MRSMTGFMRGSGSEASLKLDHWEDVVTTLHDCRHAMMIKEIKDSKKWKTAYSESRDGKIIMIITPRYLGTISIAATIIIDWSRTIISTAKFVDF